MRFAAQWPRYNVGMAQRYFLEPLPAAGRRQLTGELAHHIGTVLRARPGATVRLGDGRGGSAEARVLAVARGGIDVEIVPLPAEPPPARRVHLAFAPPRLQRAEWLFEHGTEVGTAVFHPLWTERTRPQGERLERWRKLVRAAAGQCDRTWLPEVRPARELREFLADPALPAARFLAAPRARPLATADDEVVLLVGPEGGFDAGEAAAAVAAGFEPCGLGPYTLRTETAALLGAGLLLAGVGRS